MPFNKSAIVLRPGSERCITEPLLEDTLIVLGLAEDFVWNVSHVMLLPRAVKYFAPPLVKILFLWILSFLFFLLSGYCNYIICYKGIKTPACKQSRFLWHRCTNISLFIRARLATQNALLHFPPWVVQMDWSVTCTSLPLLCNINASCHVWMLAWCLMLFPIAQYIFLPCS